MNIVHIHSIVMYLVVYIMVGLSVVGGCGNRGLPSDKLGLPVFIDYRYANSVKVVGF